MSDFSRFKTAVDEQMSNMSTLELFETDVTKEELWATYLASFPEGSNPMYRERTEHDCSCCKQFIRACGSVVTIADGVLHSIWDVEIYDGVYQVVADALSALVKSRAIRDKFLHYEKNLGTDHNYELEDGVQVKRWSHFYHVLPSRFVVSKFAIGPTLSAIRSDVQVTKRSLEEISIESVESVIELIRQNSLYRGTEHLPVLERFLAHKRVYSGLSSKAKEHYVWLLALRNKYAAIRNTVIGTLLVDLSEGKDLDEAVGSFEAKVAPQNYKRPTALVTKAMIDRAEAEVIELGIEPSLHRRYAVMDDITINNVLFADRSTVEGKSVFGELSASVKDKIGKLDKIEEVSIDKFLSDVLPGATSVEIMFENNQANSLMSLIAPVNADSKNILQWDNNFSWTYNGDVTDSIKERVKQAGGSVTGVIRCSLSWFNYDDLDIHIIEPNNNEISFRNKYSQYSCGVLDVDMNAGSGNTRNGVENITWQKEHHILEGNYRLFIHNFSKRESIDVGFDVEIEYGGNIHTFSYDRPVVGNVAVATFNYSKQNGLTILESIQSSQAVKSFWGINTQKFHKVKMIMNSPNHWDGKEVGNKHIFFILENCVNENKARGLYNEFLSNDLRDHRKVFEVLGSKLKTQESNNQLSGLGFSTTQRNTVVCRLKGSFERIIKIKF